MGENFKTDLQKYIHISKYARWKDKENRRETWDETVDRFIEFWNNRNENGVYDKETLNDIKNSILKQDVMPSMRCLMTAGKALERDEIAAFNCTASAITHPAIFSEAFYILMNGCGFGFSCERQGIANLPEVAEEFYPTETVLVIRDSKIGWATGLKELISMLYNGQIPKWDLSLVRPAGSRLKVFGGRSSGPDPLDKLYKNTVAIFKQAKGRKLNSLECHDLMCYIANTVIVGSVRRAALISLSNLSDERLRRSKDGQWWLADPQRALANNSVAYTEKPDLDSFSKEWRTLYKSKSGERGIWNKAGVKKLAIKWGRVNAQDYSYITNPCVSGDTKVLTVNGYVPIADLIDNEVEVWNGCQWSKVVPKITGVNRELINIDFSNGMNLSCTENHKFILSSGERIDAKNLKVNDKLIRCEYPIINDGNKHIDNKTMYTQGFYSGDGNTDSNLIRLYDKKCDLLEFLDVELVHDISTENNKIISTRFLNKKFEKSFVPDGIYTLKNRLSWLSGLIDSDGCSLKDGSVQIWNIDKKFLKEIVYLLNTLGCSGNISLGNSACVKPMPNGCGGIGEYNTKDCWRINISGSNIVQLRNLGLNTKRVDISYTPKRMSSRYIKVIKKTSIGLAEKVYCFTEPIKHCGIFNGILTGQCGEVALRDTGSQCNLSEVILRPDDNIDAIKSKIRIATIIGTMQSTLTNFRFLRKVWKDNAEEERLLGVSLTGIMDHNIFSGVNKNVKEWSKDDNLDTLEKVLKHLRDYAFSVNKEWAEKLGINPTCHVTTVKPSGTVSILTGTSSGIHPRYSQYYIRRVRNDKKDPLSKLMIAEGIPYVDEGDKYVFSFYVESPEHSVLQKDMDAMKQLELWRVYKQNWCSGGANPSQTIYYTDDDYFKIAAWLWDNWDDVGGLSFFPYNDASEGVYKNAPLEAISKDEYDGNVKTFPSKINWGLLSKFEHEDCTESAQTLACAGGACELT